MHEARAVAVAIDEVVRDWAPTRTTGVLRLEIRDATRAEADSVAFLAAALLQDLGLGHVSFTVDTDVVRCGSCAAIVTPTVSHPVCDGCGTPLPSRRGRSVVCHDVTPMVATTRPLRAAAERAVG